MCDDMQFLNCVFNLQYSDNTDMSWIKNINQLQIFNTKIGSDSDIDPDMNFLKCNFWIFSQKIAVSKVFLFFSDA